MKPASTSARGVAVETHRLGPIGARHLRLWLAADRLNGGELQRGDPGVRRRSAAGVKVDHRFDLLIRLRAVCSAVGTGCGFGLTGHGCFSIPLEVKHLF